MNSTGSLPVGDFGKSRNFPASGKPQCGRSVCTGSRAHTGSRVWRTIKRNFDSRHEQIHPLAVSSPSTLLPIRFCGWRLAVCRMLLPTRRKSRRVPCRGTVSVIRIRALWIRVEIYIKEGCIRERDGWSECVTNPRGLYSA